MKYLVDSDWLIDAFAGIPSAVMVLDQLRAEGLAISIISYGEIFEGVSHEPESSVHLVRLRRFLSRLALMPLDGATMERFARIRADLRRRGLLIPDLDLLIAATAVEHYLTLLTRNTRHFARIPGLKRYQPT